MLLAARIDRTRALRLATLLAAALPATMAHAARPLLTDDARVVDARACQVESWARRNHGSTELWALPACNFTGNLELSLGGSHVREGGHGVAGDVQMQGKTIFKPLATNGWGTGLALGTVRHAHAAGGGRDWYGYVPTSVSFLDDRVVLHTNLGWLHEGTAHRTRTTWGVGTEARLGPRDWLIAETFGQGSGKPQHQIGLRHWLVPDRLQIDVTYGNRADGGRAERWFSFGLRWLSAPFLP